MSRVKHKTATIYCAFFLIISVQEMYAQDLSLKISNEEFSVDGILLKGYSSNMEYPFELIKKEWWKYIKKIALLENHKSHYVITFPAAKNESNTSLSFISLIEDQETYTTLKTALKNGQLNDQHQVRAKDLLLGFKVKFYTEIIQNEIKEEEKRAAKISRSIDGYKKKVTVSEIKIEKGKGNNSILSREISSYKSKQDSLIMELQIVQSRINHSKERLNAIR